MTAPALVVPDAIAGLGDALRAVVAQAESLGLDLRTEVSGTPLQRLLAGSGGASDEAVLGIAVAGARVVHVSASPTALRLAAKEQPHAVVGETSSVHLVRAAPRPAGEDRSLGTARRFAARVLGADPRARVGISAPVRDRHELPRAAAEARDAASLADEAERAVVAEERWVDLELLRLRPQLGRGLSNPIQALLDYDRETGSDLTRTLSVWLACDRDTSAASAELCIHKNTVRYRVQRACAVADLDLTDHRQMTVVSLLLLP